MTIAKELRRFFGQVLRSGSHAHVLLRLIAIVARSDDEVLSDDEVVSEDTSKRIDADAAARARKKREGELAGHLGHGRAGAQRLV